jgi:hypothetical protein
MNPSRPQTRQALVWAWLYRTRGRLPVLEALGGRIHLPIVRRMKSWLFYRLGRLGILPPLNGFLDHGLLVDRIGATIELTYSGRRRALWLDRILLHKNHSLHLVGIDLESSEQRTFRLDRVEVIAISELGFFDKDDLYWELQTLCRPRSSWLWYWNRHQAEKGRPLAPLIGPVGRVLEFLGRVPRVVGKTPEIVVRALRRAWTKGALIYGMRHAALVKRVRAFRAASRPPGRKALRRAALLAEMPTWRRRLLRAIATVEAGGHDQITCLLPMNALLDDPARCLAYLRHLVEVTLEGTKAAPSDYPLAADILIETLALVPAAPRPLLVKECHDAIKLILRLESLQPGSKRIWIHARRRTGADARLLLCECVLTAIYGTDGPFVDEVPSSDTVLPMKLGQRAFYLTSAYFIARWDHLRFRVDATSASRLRAIVDWWDVEM